MSRPGRAGARRPAATLLLAAALAAAAGPAAAGSAGAGLPLADAAGPEAAAGPVVLTRARPAMGTLLELTAVAPDSTRAREALSAGRRAVLRLDSLLSTYRPSSEVSRLNDAAGSGAWRRLSPAAARSLREALRWAERTGGAVDPTAGPLVEAWGFDGGRERVPPRAELDSVRRLVGWEKVEVRDGARRARLPRSGMRLDFGAVGKGMALDRAVAAMREAGATGGMADLGGQVSVFGTPPGGADRWRLGIRHPRMEGRVLGAVAVDSGSVATSGDAEQFFVRDGARYSHVMDPRTGRPARGVAQVTVAAADGSAADALATALFVLGPERGRRWLRRAGPPGRGGGGLRLVLWVPRDPAGETVCPDDVVRAGPAADRVELRWSGGCPGEAGRRPGRRDGAGRHPVSRPG